MPWECEGCRAHVPLDDVLTCPTCGHAKAAWTMGRGTRRFVVGQKAHLECLRGEEREAVASTQDYATSTWVPTEEASAVPRAQARDLAAEGRAPAPRDLLTIRIAPGRSPRREAKHEVLFSGRKAEAQTFDRKDAPLEDGTFDVRVLHVFGPGDPGDVRFEGVEVVDVSEDAGYAPAVEVSMLGRATGARTVVLQGPRVRRAVLVGLFFETDVTFLLPLAVPAMKRLRAYYSQRPDVEALVVGHADSTGGEAYNLTLSEERAAVVAAFLKDDVAAWEKRFVAGRPAGRVWGTREVQWMLIALPDGGPPFLAGSPSGAQDAATKQATHDFQQWSNDARGTALVVDGIAGPGTRRELVAALMEVDGTTLPPEARLETHGCGEYHPAVPAGDGADVQANRRVEVFLFDRPPGVTPRPRKCAAPGCAEYAQWLAQVVETIDLTAEPKVGKGRWERVADVEELHLRLLDGLSRPCRDTPASVVIGDRHEFARSDATGLLRVELPAGTAEVLVRYTPPGVLEQVEVAVRLRLPPVSDDAGAQARLRNLGYLSGSDDDATSVRASIASFQVNHDLNPTGDLDAETRARLAEVHDGGGAQ